LLAMENKGPKDVSNGKEWPGARPTSIVLETRVRSCMSNTEKFVTSKGIMLSFGKREGARLSRREL